MSDIRKTPPHPRHYQLIKDVVTSDGEKLPGWAVLDPNDGVILGHGLKTRTEAIIFANGCSMGQWNMGRRF